MRVSAAPAHLLPKKEAPPVASSGKRAEMRESVEFKVKKREIVIDP